MGSRLLADQARINPDRGSPGDRLTPAPRRVLSVDAAASDAELIVQQLRRDGLEVEWSRVDTESAFREALTQPVDVIISNNSLPAFSGSRAIEILRESGLDVPLVMMSGTIGEEAAADLIRQGAADFVTKDRPTRLGFAVSRAMSEAEVRRERARALADVRLAEVRFKSLFESSVIGIIVTDLAGRIGEANSSFLTMVGHSLEDLPLDWAVMTPLEFRSKDLDMLKELNAGGSSRSWESEFVDQVGNRVPVLMGAAKSQGDSFVCFAIDMTAMKAVQASLQDAKSQLETALDELKQAQEAVIAEERLHALGQMAAGIAHDFNNSLSPIIGLSELILNRPQLIDDREKVLKFLATIHQAGRDAALVVSRLRDYYRESIGDERIEVFNLKQVVMDTLELTRTRWGAEAMARSTKYDIVTNLMDANVAGHSSELREMLVNLIFNALDAMPDGGQLVITIKGDTARPGLVNLEVADTGVGMSPEIRKRCFEPFFTTKGTSGTGLGLATTYGIVKRHHGEIRIESELGRGTRVIATIPTVTLAVEPRGPSSPLPSPMRILLVDDEEIVRNVIAEYLSADGHVVEAADGGTAALRKIQRGAYDLIITDRAMPEMGGDRFASVAKKLAPHVPILMLSGFGELMNGAGERPDGVSLVVSKPITLDALRAALVAVTGRRLEQATQI